MAFERHSSVGLERGRRSGGVALRVGERDLAICDTVAQLRFVTSDQLRDLFWPDRSERACRRRLHALFEAGCLERLRPYAYKGAGSFSWTYHLGARGHELLVDAGLRRGAFQLARVHDYGRVLHDLQVNAWVLGYRRVVGNALAEWVGEPDGLLLPPRPVRASVDGWVVADVGAAARPVRPDATLEVGGSRVLVELERRRRVDTSFEKFLRYDLFLTAWWRDVLGAGVDPYVVFVCADEEVRDAFVSAAHVRLVGCLKHPAGRASGCVWPGRRRVLFALEREVQAGSLAAVRLAGPPGGRAAWERVVLPG